MYNLIWQEFAKEERSLRTSLPGSEMLCSSKREPGVCIGISGYAVRHSAKSKVTVQGQGFYKAWYSGYHFFYAKLWTVAYEKLMVEKVRKKYEISCDGLPSSQNENEVAKPSRSWQHPPPPFLEDFGGHFHVMCAQLRPVGMTTWLGSVRRLPTRSAAPVSLDRPPLSPRLSAR